VSKSLGPLPIGCEVTWEHVPDDPDDLADYEDRKEHGERWLRLVVEHRSRNAL
jgi:hypothetical protein